jgi:transposase-like protein
MHHLSRAVSGPSQPQNEGLGGTVAFAVTRSSSETGAMRTRRLRPAPIPRAAFAGFRFPPEVIVVAVRWYLRFGLSYRDIEELLIERGIEVDHVTVYRWVLRFTPLLADAARPCRHAVGDRWQVDETYVKVAEGGAMCTERSTSSVRVIDVSVSPRRDVRAARRFFGRRSARPRSHPSRSPPIRRRSTPAVLEALLPVAWHRTDQYAIDGIECDHGRLKARLRPCAASSRTAVPG